MAAAHDVRARLQAELSEALERTLFEQARRNELVIGWVRAVAWTLATIVDISGSLAPQFVVGLDARFDLRPALVEGGVALLSVAAAIVLRRGYYRPFLRVVLPLFDAVSIALLFLAARREWLALGFGQSIYIASLALASSLFAMTGALRLSRVSVLTTSTLAAVTLLVCGAELRSSAVGAALPLSLVAATGLFGLWVTRIVRRAVRAEVERVTYSRFLPQEVVAKAGNPLALVSEPRTLDATVLVSDIRGFTSWAEQRPATEVFAFLNHVQGGFAAAVKAHGGVVDKFLGDGMLAVFGAPQPQDDHAERALAAARDILTLAQQLRDSHQYDIRIGVGVHSGRLAAGCLGSGLRLEFTIIGDTVNTASRLEALTKREGVPLLLSDETVTRLKRRPPLIELGEVEIRGRHQRLVIYALKDL